MQVLIIFVTFYCAYWAPLCPKTITNYRWSNTNGRHKIVSHPLPGHSLCHRILLAVKLRDILYSYQRKVAVCTKEEVGGLFYELSIFKLKPLVTPLRDTVEMVLRQVSGLMATNSWYPSFAEACSNILVATQQLHVYAKSAPAFHVQPLIVPVRRAPPAPHLQERRSSVPSCGHTLPSAQFWASHCAPCFWSDGAAR